MSALEWSRTGQLLRPSAPLISDRKVFQPFQAPPDAEPPQDARVGISIIIPCLNEAKTVRQTLAETAKAIGATFGDSYEILVVDDGSTDGTSAVVESAAQSLAHVHLTRMPKNAGKGNAERTAFERARGDLVCFLDGDFDIHPVHIAPFIRILQEDHVSGVIGSKRHPDSRIDYPWQRRILSAGYEMFVRALFGLRIRDTQAGIKVFKREVLDEVLPLGLVKRYAFDAELLVLAHRKGFRIVEAPIQMDSWDQIGSGVKLREVVRMFVDTLGIFYRLHVTKYYDGKGPREFAGMDS